MNEILVAISTVGFPIVMCLLQWWDKRTIMKDITDAVNNNTQAMNCIHNKEV